MRERVHPLHNQALLPLLLIDHEKRKIERKKKERRKERQKERRKERQKERKKNELLD